MRFKAQLPSGFIKNAQLKTAGCDFEVNDVVTLVDDIAMPMDSEDQEMYGVVAANSFCGQKVLIAARNKCQI